MSVRHGTYLGYVTDGCSCDDCRRAWTAKVEHCAHLRETGRQRYIDATPVKVHLEQLQERYDVSWSALMQAAGFDRAKHLGDRIHRDHARRLLTLDIDRFPPSTIVTARRMHQLVADIVDRTGWSLAETARRAGIDRQLIQKRRRRTSLSNVIAVMELHRELSKPRCEDCEEPSLAGGRWCLDCFYERHPAPAPVKTGCGTDAGYTAHRRAGTEACKACKAAHAETKRRRTAA